ncbi:enoyl-CoA hydratase-related protein [Myxococcota bacterium]|nr:enoyl-CoA hydratase-related protein [Myxococcota bacterium]
MSNSHVRYEERGDAAFVVIDRPDCHNALATETLRQLLSTFAHADASRCAAIVVTGAGTRAFCSGGDIEEMRSATPETGRVFLGAFLELMLALRRSKKPVIARVDGFCLGGGNEIALTCDLTIASDRATFGQVGPSVGSAPVLAATQLLPRIVGEKRAREIVFLCERYTATQALEMGWINRVVPAADLDDAVSAWCTRIADMSPQSLRIAKTSLNSGTDTLLPSFNQGVEMLAAAFGTEEFREGTGAFLEKRKPDFRRFR